MISVESLQLMALEINAGRRLNISPYRFHQAIQILTEIEKKKARRLPFWRLILPDWG
jgi:hypothetical protein